MTPHETVHAHIHVPQNAREWAGKKPGVYHFVSLLETSSPIVETDAEALDTQGLPVDVPPGGALVLEWC